MIYSMDKVSFANICSLIAHFTLYTGPQYNYDNAMDYHSDSQASSSVRSTGSWLNVPTLPPTPPRMPPPDSEDKEQPLEDEDGFAHIMEDDYHEI
jgi:hypothetical protein